MKRIMTAIASALLVCAGAQAATINTTLTVTASGALTGTSFTATGTATLTNIGSGTFSSTLSLTSADAAGNLTAPYTITLSGGAGTITGTLKIPPALLSGSGTNPLYELTTRADTVAPALCGAARVPYNPRTHPVN